MTKLFKRKSGILAPRIVARPYIPWRHRLLTIVIIIALLFTLSWTMYEAGSKSVELKATTDVELDRIYDQVVCSQKTRKELCTQIAALIRQLQINDTTGQELASQAKSLGNENNRLREELAFFQHLLSGNEEIGAGVSIYLFNLKKGQSPGKYRYTLILVQGGQRPKNFQGNLKFTVTLRQNDQIKTVPLTAKNASDDFSLNFKFYHKVEESFQVPPDTVVESLQVRVFENNKTEEKLTKTVRLSL